MYLLFQLFPYCANEHTQFVIYIHMRSFFQVLVNKWIYGELLKGLFYKNRQMR
jgi:hypothetical protein